VIWFNKNADKMDWVIESSHSAQAAFKKAISVPYYSDGNYSNLSASPIKPLGS
jgi:hypothetical protein